MTFEEFKNIIQASLENRFIVQEKNPYFNNLVNLAPETLTKDLLRIKRNSSIASGLHYKTILIVCLKHENQLEAALQWTALVKDSLLDPETADLYLFIYYESQCQPSNETCLRIESTEQFCRKYVLRPNEEGIHFIERTFFAKSDDTDQELLLSDPLNSVFTSVAEKHSWFTEEEQIKWKDALTSGLTGSELIDKIFKNKMDDELPSKDNN